MAHGLDGSRESCCNYQPVRHKRRESSMSKSASIFGKNSAHDIFFFLFVSGSLWHSLDSDIYHTAIYVLTIFRGPDVFVTSARAMNQAPVSCIPAGKMSKAKKVLDEAREIQNPELDLADKGISTFGEVPGLLNMLNITRLTLSHNKINVVPPGLANLVNLEILNLFNNHITELPISLSQMPKLRILNVGMNRLDVLPRGFGAFPAIEVLDLTYNNLNEKQLPGNFFMMETLRALYLADNDFEYLPSELGQLKNLQILVLRENDLIELPKEIGELNRLRELHIQGNRLTVLPPEIGNLDMVSNKAVFRMEFNPWVTPIGDQLQVGISHVMDYIRSETYKYVYNRHQNAKGPPPTIENDKSKKISRAR